MHRFSDCLAQTSPLLWDWERWAAISGVAGSIVLVAFVLLCAVSFAFPPPILMVLGAIGAFVAGGVISLAVVLFAWPAVALVRWWRSAP